VAVKLATVTASEYVFPGVRVGLTTARGGCPGRVVGYTDHCPLLAAEAGRPDETLNIAARQTNAMTAPRPQSRNVFLLVIRLPKLVIWKIQ
jgi:hypothetical protein